VNQVKLSTIGTLPVKNFMILLFMSIEPLYS